MLGIAYCFKWVYPTWSYIFIVWQTVSIPYLFHTRLTNTSYYVRIYAQLFARLYGCCTMKLKVFRRQISQTPCPFLKFDSHAIQYNSFLSTDSCELYTSSYIVYTFILQKLLLCFGRILIESELHRCIFYVVKICTRRALWVNMLW